MRNTLPGLKEEALGPEEEVAEEGEGKGITTGLVLLVVLLKLIMHRGAMLLALLLKSSVDLLSGHSLTA